MPDSFLKKVFKSEEQNRKKLWNLVITPLLLLLIIYFLFNRYERGGWELIFSRNLVQEQSVTGFSFSDSTICREVSPWRFTEDGLKSFPGQWLWLDGVDLASSGKVELTIKYGSETPPGSIDVSMFSRKQPLTKFGNLPPGYSFTFGGYEGRLDIISKNETEQPGDSIISANSSIKPESVHKIIFEKQGEQLSIIVDGKVSLSMSDITPLDFSGYDEIGLRSNGNPFTIMNISIYRYTGKARSEGDLSDAELVFKGAKTIKKLWEKFEREDDALKKDELLTKIFFICSRMPTEFAEEMTKVRTLVFGKFPSSKTASVILEKDCLEAWKNGFHEEAFGLLDRIFSINPETRIVLKVISSQLLPIEHEETATRLMKYLARTKSVRVLQLSGLGISDISELKKLPVIYMDISDNKFSNLSSLSEMKDLRYLECSYNKISSLEPLKDIKLNALFFNGNQVKDLSPLKNMKLKAIMADGNQIESIEPLREMTLRRVFLSRNQISDISPLKNSASTLDMLDISENKVSDISTLSEMSNLLVLDIGANPVTDLSALGNLKLGFFSCQETNISSLGSFENKPPPFFLFYCKNIDKDSYERLSKKWKEEKLHVQSEYAGIYAALKSPSHDALRKYEKVFQHHRYLLIPIKCSFNQAKAIAQKLGGNLTSPSTVAENEFISEFIPDNFTPWIGLVNDKDGLRWIDGSPIRAIFCTKGSMLEQGAYRKIINGWDAEDPENARHTFIVEWQK